VARLVNRELNLVLGACGPAVLLAGDFDVKLFGLVGIPVDFSGFLFDVISETIRDIEVFGRNFEFHFSSV
jgi:hypothetical protein